MSSRSLTDAFVLMRNNALQSRHLQAEQSMTDHARLLSDEPGSNSGWEVDLETGQDIPKRQLNGAPPWGDSLDEGLYIISRLRTKISELQQVHSQHVQRPTLDDSCVEEQQASRLTSEISHFFTVAYEIIQSIKGFCYRGSPSEQKLARNVLSSVVTTMQELSLNFRSSQSNYLKSLTSREERSNAFFELPNFDDLDANSFSISNYSMKSQDVPYKPGTSNTQLKNNVNSSAFFEEEEDQDIDEMFQKPANSRMNQQQLLMYEEDNTKLALHREQEVNKIVNSIVELNDVFKDLAHMVQDQGTVLDRIDYNIEQTQMSVYDGYKQLQKAEGYHRKNRKMHCIFILGSTAIVLFILLLILKS